MAIDPRKRQKQLAKKRAKRKTKQIQARQSRPGSFRTQPLVLSVAEMEKGMVWPVGECYVSETIFSGGMGSVIISRNSGIGRRLVGIFLIDAYCLGVKDAFTRYLSNEDLQNFLTKTDREQGIKKVDPAYAKKLIEGAVAYAWNLGLGPHPDFIPSSHILSDIDSSSCKENFTFGLDGKPMFLPGPYDSDARVRQVVQALSHRIAKGEAHYMIEIPPDTEVFLADDEDDDYEEDEDEEGENR